MKATSLLYELGILLRSKDTMNLKNYYNQFRPNQALDGRTLEDVLI